MQLLLLGLFVPAVVLVLLVGSSRSLLNVWSCTAQALNTTMLLVARLCYLPGDESASTSQFYIVLPVIKKGQQRLQASPAAFVGASWGMMMPVTDHWVKIATA